jgi:KDO2-lipid IV(A) lauroyltransferase
MRPARAHWRWIRFHLLRFVLAGLASLPRRPGLWFFGQLGLLAGRVLRKPNGQIVANSRLVFPEWSDELRSSFARRVLWHLGRNAFDFIRLPKYSEEEIWRLVSIDGGEHLRRARRPGVGVVALSAHLGCWELIPYRMRVEGYDVSVVYRRLYDRNLDRYVARRRQRFGIRTHDRDRDARGMLRSLRAGALLGVMIDQRTRVDSVRVPFMGHPAWTPTGAVRLALMAGAPIVPMVLAMRGDGRYRLTIGPEVPVDPDGGRATGAATAERVAEATARCNAALSELILRDHEQWVWFHERWADI